MAEQRGPKRRRRRHSVDSKEGKKIADRVNNFYVSEETNSSDDVDARIQRYAKYRMWQAPTDWPWDNASNAIVPDMFQDSVRVQDTLHNAVMSQIPPVGSRATSRSDKDKEKFIDELIMHQVFKEQPGERVMGETIESFVNDPAVTVFVPWVRERKPVANVQIFSPIPKDMDPSDYFTDIIMQNFPEALSTMQGAGWDWDLELASEEEGEETVKLKAAFYTSEDDRVEMVVEKTVIVYDGPKLIVKDYNDVIYPARSANLQPPSPSNPGGAPYVILRDFPTKHEILELLRSGYYDLKDDDIEEKIRGAAQVSSEESDTEQQKDVFAGKQEDIGLIKDKTHGRLTRLLCFDKYDIDGDGVEEDVVFWVIKETNSLVRARLLSDINPGIPPRRPIFGESFYPVQGRYAGISLLESMEGVHDAVKVLLDQVVNANDLSIASPGFYRPAGGANPEQLQIEPYSLVPLQNPDQDITFPNIGNPQAVSQGFNLMSMLGAWQDKSTMVSDMSFGQVPSGGSSALRTIGGMSLLQGQGESRPERILRRFFMLLTSIWEHIHRMNQSYLSKDKQFRVTGTPPSGSDPYISIPSRNFISGRFQFEFAANVFNTSKRSLQDSLGAVMQSLVSGIALQTGISTPDTIYNLLRDFTMAQGQDANRYMNAPNPKLKGPTLFAEEAMTQIFRGQLPIGEPAEQNGYAEHLPKMAELFGQYQAELQKGGLAVPQLQQQLLQAYMQRAQQGAQAEQQEQQMLAAAQQFQQGQQGQQGQPGAPVTNPQAPPTQPPPVSGPNEMIDETLPGAGGGANTGAM